MIQNCGGGGGVENICPCRIVIPGITLAPPPLGLCITCPSIRDKYILSLNK